ncbi:hypothetical protein HLH26_12735 [Gluconacetobacter sp. 1b LMG 1731]|uniref:Uncharacterized protein n=1 Tax=Gluconacetobacter dulcium TaxID=2729096 RepID=A0A7W4IM44_9PROT|nr:hypothetical protein [Gluconacetobacter dulcium]MBB2165383.1 hypothetical protein [Gluconacetobacter dulcium]MBB2194450.1 hypothetical protein [Gluconacetobacter dulcium]
MIGLSHITPPKSLPVPVSCQMMQGGAARFGRRTPGPHDWPAAPSVLNHGDDQRGAVVWEMYTLPSTEDRLQNGIRLSDTFHAFAFLDDWIENHFNGMSQAMCQCIASGMPEQAFDHPENAKHFISATDLPSIYLRNFHHHYYSIYKEIESLLKSGRLSAYGKTSIEDKHWKVIRCSDLSLDCELLFSKNKIVIEGQSFLDVRVVCAESLPISCALIAYGDQELVPRLMRLAGYCRSTLTKGAYKAYLLDEIRTFLKYFLLLMQKGHLEAFRTDDGMEIDASVWNHCKISLSRSEISTRPGEWLPVKIVSPIPPLEGNTSANNSHSKGHLVGSGRCARGYEEADAPLVEEMRTMIVHKKAHSAWHAAELVADRAEGGGTFESRQKRLHGKYQRLNPDQ